MANRKFDIDRVTQKICNGWVASFKGRGTFEDVLNMIGIYGSNEYQIHIEAESNDNRGITLSIKPDVEKIEDSSVTLSVRPDIKKSDRRNKQVSTKTGSLAGEIVLGYKTSPLTTQTIEYRTKESERAYKCELGSDGRIRTQLINSKTIYGDTETTVEIVPGISRDELTATYEEENNGKNANATMTLTVDYPQLSCPQDRTAHVDIKRAEKLMHSFRFYPNISNFFSILIEEGIIRHPEQMPGITLVRSFNGKSQDKIASSFGKCIDFTITAPPITATIKGDGSRSMEIKTRKEEVVKYSRTAKGIVSVSTVVPNTEETEKDTITAGENPEESCQASIEEYLRAQSKMVAVCFEKPLKLLEKTRDGMFKNRF